MVTISTQHLQDIFASLGLEIHDNNNDGQFSVSTKQSDSKSPNTDTISYNVQTAPNKWRKEEYTLTENDLISYKQFTALIQRLSGNKEIFILGDDTATDDKTEYAILKRPYVVYERDYFSNLVDYVNLETGSSFIDAIKTPTSYAYKSLRYFGITPKLSFFDDSITTYQAEILKCIKLDEEDICSDQTSKAFERKCSEDIFNLTDNFELSLEHFVTGFLKAQKHYADFTTRYEQGALKYSDVTALEHAFAEFELIDQAYQAKLKAIIQIIRAKKSEAEAFRSAKVKAPQ